MWVVRINSTPPQDKVLRKVITVGRHLDNDVIVGGERIADHHARIETDERGSRLVPVQGRSSIEVNGTPLSVPFGLKPGDAIRIGDTTMSIVDDDDEATITRVSAILWELEGEKGELMGEHVTLNRIITVGRSDDCDVVMKEGHISRAHARLHPIADEVYLEDLGSANGTYVNGQRIWGAMRLHHGDHVRFDEASFRVYGKTVAVESGATVIRTQDSIEPIADPATPDQMATAKSPAFDEDETPTRVMDLSATVENPQVPAVVKDEEAGLDLDAIEDVGELGSDALESADDIATAETSVTDLSEIEQAMAGNARDEKDGESETKAPDEAPLLKTIAMAPALPTIVDANQIPPTMVLEAQRLPPERNESTEPLTVEGGLPRLIGLTPPVTGEVLLLRQGRMILGRASDCDLVVSEPSISSRHAQVIVNAAGATLMNLFSANGTFVNGEPIDTVKLKPGDVIQIGRVQFMFEPNEKMLAGRKSLPKWAYALVGFGVVVAVLAVLMLI
ncbi:MAG: FHA domain-containing protein [Pseudomonadales bacterium]